MQSTPHDRVSVCILSTGDELTAPGLALKPGKIYDSNSTMLKALLSEHGFHNVVTHVVGDEWVSSWSPFSSSRCLIPPSFSFGSLRSAVSDNLSSKFIVCSGGVSMGDKDFLKDVLSDLTFTTHFGRVNMKPGCE